MSEIMQAARRRLEAFSLTEISSRSLGMLRVFGALTVYIEFASPWVSHRMDDYLGALLLSWVMFISATFVIFGFKTRIATIVLALAFGGLHLYYGVEVGVTKLAAPVMEFQFLVLLALTPCGRSLSVDRALAVKRALAEGREPEPERMPWWQLELFVVQAATMYLWIGHESMQPEWLTGARIEHDLMKFWSGSDLLAYAPAAHTIVVVVAWVVMLTCFALAVGLLSRRLRPYLMWLGVALQFAVMFSFVHTWLSSYYPFMQLALLISCVRPDRLHEFITAQGDQPAGPPAGGPDEEPPGDPEDEPAEAT